jgi:hypothetical protein
MKQAVSAVDRVSVCHFFRQVVECCLGVMRGHSGIGNSGGIGALHLHPVAGIDHFCDGFFVLIGRTDVHGVFLDLRIA